MAIFVDYESPLARTVAGTIWSGLSAVALGAGYTRITAFWESLREDPGPREPESSLLNVFVIGQDHPDGVDAIAPVGDPGGTKLYGLVVAVPTRPSPLSGPLLYQGVERLTRQGVGAGQIEPAPLRDAAGECEMYARKLFERLRKLDKKR